MQWIIELFCLLGAAIAVALTTWQGRTLSVLSAAVRTMALRLDSMPHLTSSSLAELAELKDALQRGEELLLKVNRREIANAKTRAGNGTFSNLTTKDELRARAGLRAGQVPRHE